MNKEIISKLLALLSIPASTAVEPKIQRVFNNISDIHVNKRIFQPSQTVLRDIMQAAHNHNIPESRLVAMSAVESSIGRADSINPLQLKNEYLKRPLNWSLMNDTERRKEYLDQSAKHYLNVIKNTPQAKSEVWKVQAYNGIPKSMRSPEYGKKVLEYEKQIIPQLRGKN